MRPIFLLKYILSGLATTPFLSRDAAFSSPIYVLYAASIPPTAPFSTKLDRESTISISCFVDILFMSDLMIFCIICLFRSLISMTSPLSGLYPLATIDIIDLIVSSLCFKNSLAVFSCSAVTSSSFSDLISLIILLMSLSVMSLDITPASARSLYSANNMFFMDSSCASSTGLMYSYASPKFTICFSETSSLTRLDDLTAPLIF